MVASTKERLYPDDFFSGIFAALNLMGIEAFDSSRTRLSSAFEKVFEDLEREAQERGLEIAFNIKRHPVHGDSVMVRDGIRRCIIRQELTTYIPSDGLIRINGDRRWAAMILEGQGAPAGGREMYERLARKFWGYFRDYVEGT